jgi:hypothetical protein
MASAGILPIVMARALAGWALRLAFRSRGCCGSALLLTACTLLRPPTFGRLRCCRMHVGGSG